MPFTPLTITGFKRGENNEIFVKARRFRNISPFFEEPLNSLSALGICTADRILEERGNI